MTTKQKIGPTLNKFFAHQPRKLEGAETECFQGLWGMGYIAEDVFEEDTVVILDITKDQMRMIEVTAFGDEQIIFSI